MNGGERDRILLLLPIAFRSRVRRLVLLVLKRNETWLSVSEITRESGLTSSEVIGAIRGTEGQYSPDLSLLRLHLISESISKPSGVRLLKTYNFACQDEVLLDALDRVIARYQKAGEA